MNNHHLNQKLSSIEELLRKQRYTPKEVMTVDELSLYISLSKSYIYKLTSKRIIPYYTPNGKKLYFKKSEIDVWLLKNKSQSNEELDLKVCAYLAQKGGKV